GATSILVATTHGARGNGRGTDEPGARRHAGGGPAGLIKTVAAEYPKLRARVVDLDAGDPDAAALLHRELHASDAHVEISYVAGVRSTLQVVSAELTHAGEVPLGPDSVVLITGGARGITAKVAIALVHRHGCRIELVGRSPLPGGEDPAIAAARDAPALRRLLLERAGA